MQPSHAMKLKNLFLFVGVMTSVFCLRAEPTKLTYEECDQLYRAINAVPPGLTIDNVGTLAENLNAVTPHVKAYDAAKMQAAHDYNAVVATSPDVLAQRQKVQDGIDAFGQKVVTVDIIRLDIPKDEWKGVNIAPKDYAILIHLLKPLKKT